MENERNIFTGTLQKKNSGDILNPLTGRYRKDNKTDDRVEKSNSRWPSISQRKDPEPQPQPEPVRKSTDENPWPSLTNHLSDDDVNISKGQSSISMDVPIFISKADEQIVCGIVYAPDEVDSQGDQANAAEIRKAAFLFMQSNQTLKVMHKGKSGKMKLLESYIAPQTLLINKQTIKKGSWIITVKVIDKKLWADVKSGKLTGFSMAGTARSD